MTMEIKTLKTKFGNFTDTFFATSPMKFLSTVRITSFQQLHLDIVRQDSSAINEVHNDAKYRHTSAKRKGR